MTRVVKGNKFIPVTLLEIPRLKVVGKRTLEKDGYTAIMVGILKAEDSKLKTDKAALSASDFSNIKEFTLNEGDDEKFVVGEEISLDVLDGVETVTIVGTSKGK